MRSASAGKPAVDFAKPEDVVTASIDPATGELATPDCPKTRDEFFVAGTEPTKYCSRHGGDAMEPLVPELPTQPELPMQPGLPEQPEQPEPASEPSGVEPVKDEGLPVPE